MYVKLRTNLLPSKYDVICARPYGRCLIINRRGHSSWWAGHSLALWRRLAAWPDGWSHTQLGLQQSSPDRWCWLVPRPDKDSRPSQLFDQGLFSSHDSRHVLSLVVAAAASVVVNQYCTLTQLLLLWLFLDCYWVHGGMLKNILLTSETVPWRRARFYAAKNPSPWTASINTWGSINLWNKRAKKNKFNFRTVNCATVEIFHTSTAFRDGQL